jgi:elongation factor P--(R)-beta-lysine ligase
MTPELLADPARRLELRSGFLGRIRDFFRGRGFVELDTPLLERSVPTEAHIAPFTIELHRAAGAGERRFLPTSPEGALKRQLGLLGRDAFELGHAFRDGEEEGGRHRAHFRMLEWYRLGATLAAVQDDLAALLADLADWFRAAAPDQAPPAALAHPEPEVVTVPEAFARHLGHPVTGPADLDALVPLARARGHLGIRTWPEAFHVLAAIDVEPHLGRGRPTFLSEYPAGISAMARPLPDRPWLAEQLELFVDGVELANCYAEITDPALQAERFAAEAARAAAEGRAAPPPDPALLAALRRLPERTAGGSVGVERLLMLWLGAGSLDEVRPGW